MRDDLFLIKGIVHCSQYVISFGEQILQLMDTSSSEGSIQIIRRSIVLSIRKVATFVLSAYDVVVLWVSELSPGGRVRLRFLVYLSIILSLNYLSTVGMTSSPALLNLLRYNTSITKITLSYVTGYLFVTYISQKLNPLIRLISIVTIPSMLMCLLEEEVIWKTYKTTFSSFLFLVYVSSIVPRQDSMSSIGPVTVIISMSSMYLSLLLYIIPIMAPWQCTLSHMAWFFGILLGASGLLIDDLQVVMGSSEFPVGLVKRRARKYAYVIFVYYLVLYYSMAKLLTLQNC